METKTETKTETNSTVDWGSLIWIVWLILIFGGIAISEYSTKECRTNGIQHNYTAEQIKEICK